MDDDYLICTEIDDDDSQNDINNSPQKAVFVKKFIWEINCCF